MTSFMVAADPRSTGKLSWGVEQLWRTAMQKRSWCVVQSWRKDTASYDVVHGSSRYEIKGETIIRRSTVLKNDKAAISDVGSAERQGFQHVYKLRNTTLSRRVSSAKNLSIQNGYPQSKQAIKRDKEKKKKIDSLLVVASSPEHSLCKAFFLNSRPIFYSGKTEHYSNPSTQHWKSDCSVRYGKYASWWYFVRSPIGIGDDWGHCIHFDPSTRRHQQIDACEQNNNIVACTRGRPNDGWSLRKELADDCIVCW